MDNSTEALGGGSFAFKKTKQEYEVAALFVFFVLLDICGNSLVITVLLTRMRRSFKTMVILLTSLAVADLLHGIFVGLPFAVQRFMGTWSAGSVVCKIYTFIRGIIGEVSVYTLAVIGCERFRSLKKPESKSVNPVVLYGILTVIWIYLIAVGLPYALVFDIYERPGVITCAFRPDSDDYTEFVDFVMTFSKVANFAVPLVFVVISYIGVIFLMWKAQKRVDTMQGSTSHNKKQKQVAKLCVMIMLAFLICWTPLRIALIARVVYPKSSVWPTVIGYSRIGTMLGSCLNPIIYGLMWKQFRDNTRKMLTPVLVLCFPKWIQQSEANGSTQMPNHNQLTVTTARSKPPTTDAASVRNCDPSSQSNIVGTSRVHCSSATGNSNTSSAREI